MPFNSNVQNGTENVCLWALYDKLQETYKARNKLHGPYGWWLFRGVLIDAERNILPIDSIPFYRIAEPFSDLTSDNPDPTPRNA